jgi:hypothetical protein
LNSLVFEITASGTSAQAVGSGSRSRIQSTDDDDNEDRSTDGGSETGSGDSPPIVPVDDED